MNTLGPRIMVNVGTQAATHTGPNPRDLAPLTNDAFLATFLGKPALPTSNGTSIQHNNYRPSYGAFRSKQRSFRNNGESIEPDSAILSIIRGNTSDNNQQQFQRQFYDNRNHRRPFHKQQFYSGWNDVPCSPNYRPQNDSNRRLRTRSDGTQKQITVVDQMAAQPHIPYAILPKRFEPKQVPTNGHQQPPRSSNTKNSNNVARRPQHSSGYYNNQRNDINRNRIWSEPSNHQGWNRRPNRSFGVTSTYRGSRQRFNEYYDSYRPQYHHSISRQGQAPNRSHHHANYQDNGYGQFKIVPSYDLNEWQGPYARSRQLLNSQRNGFRRGQNDRGFIRDDHRINNSSKPSRNSHKTVNPGRRNKTTKSPKNKRQQKRRVSRQRKQRNQNSKSEGTLSTSASDSKSTTESETVEGEQVKQEEETPVPTTATETDEKSLPPSDSETKETEVEKPAE